MDEATQCTEPAALIPITKGCRSLVMVGDHRQLPATLLSYKARKENLGGSLFERLVQAGEPLSNTLRREPRLANT
eukprot:3794231-Pyramimonas_sp.AAC.1